VTEPYRNRIEQYCTVLGIAVPSAFGRNSPGRYAAIDLSQAPPKLIARTWHKQEDVAHYLEHYAEGREIRILDFREREELLFREQRFFRGAAF